MGFCCLRQETLCASGDITRVARFGIDAPVGEHTEHLHSSSRHLSACFEFAIQNVAKRFAVSFRHAYDATFNLLNERQTVQLAVPAKLSKFLIRIEWVSIITFVSQVWKYAVFDFSVNTVHEPSEADFRKEHYDCIHRLAVRVNLHHANRLISAKMNTCLTERVFNYNLTDIVPLYVHICQYTDVIIVLKF